MILAQISPETVVKIATEVATKTEKQPWEAVVFCLLALVATVIAGLVWFARSVVPWQRDEKKADREHQALMQATANAHQKELLEKRGQESARDVEQITREISTKISYEIRGVNQSVETLRADLARLLGKSGLSALLMFWGLTSMTCGSPTVVDADSRPRQHIIDLDPVAQYPGLPVYSIRMK